MLQLTANMDLYANPALRKRLDRLADLPVEVAREVAARQATVLTREARRALREGGARGLHVRSGNLLTHTVASVKDTPRGATIELRTLFYGRVNARGATIRPKNGPYLVFRIGGRLIHARKVIIPKRDWDALAMERTRAQLPATVRQAVVARFRRPA